MKLSELMLLLSEIASEVEDLKIKLSAPVGAAGAESGETTERQKGESCQA